MQHLPFWMRESVGCWCLGKGLSEAEGRGPVLTSSLCGFGELSQRAPLLAAQVFVGVYLKFTLLANLVCVSHRCGKTTICQVFAALANQKLYSVNCHLHMGPPDFLGAAAGEKEAK